MRCKLLLWYF